MDSVAQFNEPTDRPTHPPGPWARAREAEGGRFGVSAPDHISAAMSGPYPWRHVFVTLTEMACATSRVHLNASSPWDERASGALRLRRRAESHR